MASPVFLPEDALLCSDLSVFGDPFADDFSVIRNGPEGGYYVKPDVEIGPLAEDLNPFVLAQDESKDDLHLEDVLVHDIKVADVQGEPICDSYSAFTPGLLSREPTKPKLMPSWGLLEGNSELQGSNDAVTTEIMRRADDIFHALVLVQQMPEYSCISSGQIHAHTSSQSSTDHMDSQGGTMLREVRRLEFEAAILRHKVHMLHGGGNAKGTLCKKRGVASGKVPGKAKRSKKQNKLGATARDVEPL